MLSLKYLSGYPPQLLAQASALLEQGELLEGLARRHGPMHDVRSDSALFEYVSDLKNRFLRNTGPLAKVAYDSKLQLVQQALGTHTRVSRVQGNRLTAKREIRVASLFKQAPAPFLKMIVVHELAHLKKPAHDKTFYSLCTIMEPAYQQLEFDVRLWLCALEFDALRDTPRLAPVRTSAACQ